MEYNKKNDNDREVLTDTTTKFNNKENNQNNDKKELLAI